MGALDGFRLGNDGLGHAAGDELLVHFSRRLASVLRDCDLAARTAGDEFVTVCSDLANAAAAEFDVIASVLDLFEIDLFLGKPDIAQGGFDRFFF